MSHTILLVDDEPYLLHALSRALRRQPFKIYTARSAEESVTILKRHTVHLIISDDRMNGMRGTDFLTWAADSFPEIPRIMLTGHGDYETRRRAAEEAKVYEFFMKPCDTGKLAGAIRAALSKQRTGKPSVIH